MIDQFMTPTEAKLRARKDEFMAFMRAWDDDALPDGAWMEKLTEGAAMYARAYKVDIDPHDGTLFYAANV